MSFLYTWGIGALFKLLSNYIFGHGVSNFVLECDFFWGGVYVSLALSYKKENGAKVLLKSSSVSAVGEFL